MVKATDSSLNCLCVQRAKKEEKLLSIEECILYAMLKKVGSNTAWGAAIKQIIKQGSNEKFRELIRQLGEQIRDGKDCKETMINIIGIHAVNKIISLTR